MTSSKELRANNLIELDLLKQKLDKLVEISPVNPSIRSSLPDFDIREKIEIANFKISKGKISIEPNISFPSKVKKKAQKKVRRKLEWRLRDIFLQSSVIKPKNLDEILKRLAGHDDVILGLDTNVILNCLVTSVLLKGIYEQTFPNWVLFVVPKIVMSEIENKSNKHSSEGRIGQRGIQEILEINKPDPDRPGISMVITGDIPRNYDSLKSDGWRTDSEIRNQFRKFLNDLEFQKGTYFLTQDRVNAMMADSEGTEGLYLQKPSFEDLAETKVSLEKLSRFIYEACILLGEIEVKCENRADLSLCFKSIWTGKQISDWEESKLKIVDL